MSKPTHTELKTKRCERRLSVGRASQITRIPKSTYLRIETGTNPPSLEAAFAIEKKFGIPMSTWVEQPCA